MVRHRMRNRRGRTRGGSSRPQTDPHPKPATSSPSPELHHPQRYGLSKYPSTHSGRGHARPSGANHEDNEQPASHVDNSDLHQEEAPRRSNGRDTGKNLLDEGNFALHGKNIGGSQHVEGGSSTATHSPGGISYDGLAPQVAIGRHSDTHPAEQPLGSGGWPHSRVSMEEADDWACPIVEEPIPDEFK